MPKKIITKSQSRKYKKRSLKNMNGGANGINLILGNEYADSSPGTNNFRFKYDTHNYDYTIIDNKLSKQGISLGEIMCGKILIIDNINTSKLRGQIEFEHFKKGIYIIQSVELSEDGFHIFNTDSINSYLNN